MVSATAGSWRGPYQALLDRPAAQRWQPHAPEPGAGRKVPGRVHAASCWGRAGLVAAQPCRDRLAGSWSIS